MLGKLYLGPLHLGSSYCLQSEKVINKTNFTTSMVKILPYQTLRAMVKVCGKLISRKLVLSDGTQLKARYLFKANQIQSAWGSPKKL